MPDELIGEVSHWFGKIMVAGITLSEDLNVGDRIHILGHTTDFEQDVGSMQIDNANVTGGHAGDEIGVKLASRARTGDRVYKVG